MDVGNRATGTWLNMADKSDEEEVRPGQRREDWMEGSGRTGRRRRSN